MAKENLDKFNLIPPADSEVIPAELPAVDVMSGTPTSSTEVNFENIKDDLIVEGSDQPLGSFDIEGLDRATALNDMVARYPVNALISGNLKDEDLNDNVFGNIVDEVRHEVALRGKKNEVQPLRFSIKGSNFDRYYHSPQFQNLGFHPYADNESQYNQVSSWWDENARARSQYWNIFKTGFLSTYKSLGDLVSGNYLRPDMDEAEAYADAMRIGNSTQEGTGAFWNNLMLNSAYTVGIMSNIALEELAMAGLEMATFGGATPLVANRTAYNAVRGYKSIDKLFDMGAYAERSRKMLQSMKNVDFAKDFWLNSGRFVGNALTPNTLKALKSIESVQGTARSLSGIAKTAKTFGGMYRDFRAVNLAMAESKLEGGMVKNDLLDELYREFVEEHGRAPVGAELERLVRKADEAAFTTTMLNAPIIFLSNAFIFDTALRGFGTAGKLMNQQRQGIFNRIIKKAVVKKGDKAFEYGGSAWQAFRKRGFSGGLKTFAGAALNYGRFNLIEGLQEITQEGIAVGAKDYYRNLYNDPMAAGSDAIWASTMAGAKSQWSGEGFEVFMSGFLMGGLVRGPQKAVFEGIPNLYKRTTDPEGYKKYQQEKEDYIKETVDILNKAYEDPAHYFDMTKLNALNQKQVNENLFATVFSENVQEFQDEKDAGVFSALHRIIESGQMFHYREQMEDYLKLDDQGLAEAFKNATEEEIKSGKTRERLQGMLDRMDDVEKAYKDLNEEIINPFDPSEFKKGSKEYNNEVISQVAFNHAKMLALYTRDTFQRALERSNQIYTELSSDPIVKKMASNDIDALVSTQSLISEIRLLKIELRNTIEPTKEEGVELSSDEKVIYESKKKRLRLLQDYFSVLTDPKNIEKYEAPTTKVDEEAEKDEFTKIIVGDAVKEVRENILSTRNITDKEAEALVVYETGSANPFGVFDSANIENLREVVTNYLNFISNQEKDSFMDQGKFDEFLTKLVDHKSLKGRAEDYNKAVNILINPKSLYDLANKMEAGFWEIFMENKLGVEKRMKAHVEAAEKNEFLKQLAEYGIYPEVTQAEEFLKGGAAPYLYVTEDGVLNGADNPTLEKKKDEILAIYLNTSKNTVQKKKAEKKEDVKEEEYDPYNFENTHFEKGEDISDVDEKNISNYTGNKYGDQFLVRKHKEYLLSREGKGTKEKTLIKIEEWLESPISKRARVIEHAIKRIYDEIYIREKLVGGSEDSFFNWVETMKEDPRVSDILRSVDVQISDFVESKEEIEDDATPQVKNYKVEKEQVRDRLTGDKETVYKVRDKDGNTISDKVHTSKKDAIIEKDIAIDRSNKKLADNKSFEFAGVEYKKGDILTDNEGNKYMVFSTPAMVAANNNIYIKEYSKISSKKKKDKLFVEEDAFKAMKLDKYSALDYRNTKGKIKSNEPLVITPVWDYGASDYLEKGKFEQQEFLRNLTEDDKRKVTFKITPGPKWFAAEETTLENKISFTEFDGGIKNDLIKKHAQKWQVEVQMNGETIGYFQGPTTLKLLNRHGEVINPMEITEAQVQDFFKLYSKDKIKDKTEEIRNNYSQSYYIYNKIDSMMTGKDIGEFTQEELGVVLNISEGSMAIADEGDGVLFKELDYNTLNIISKEDLYNSEEDPYYFIDYNRIYQGDEKGTKQERSIITNIRPNTPSYAKLKEELRKYENKFSPKQRLGKYVAFVTMPNGKTAYVYTKPQTMTESEVTDLFTEWKSRSIETVNNNIDNEGKVKTVGYNKKYNNKLAEKLFISATEGVYLEMKLSENGDFRVDYSDLTVKKNEKQKGIPRAKVVIPAKILKGMDDVQDLLDVLNNKMFGKGSPIKDKTIVTLENFKRALPKDPNIDDLMNTETLLDKEVKKNFNFSLSSTENINVIKRRIAKSDPIVKSKTTKDLSPEEIKEAHLDDFSNVDFEILEDIAKKQLSGEELEGLDAKIAKFNAESLKGIRLKLSTKSVNSLNTQGEAVNQRAVNSIQELSQKIKERKREIRKNNRKMFAVVAAWLQTPEGSLNNQTAEQSAGKFAVEFSKRSDLSKKIAQKAEEDITGGDLFDMVGQGMNVMDKVQKEIERQEEESSGKMSELELNEINKSDIANDIKIKAWNLELAKAKGQANKIINNFDGHDIEDIETFINWLKHNLPENIRVDITDLGGNLKRGYRKVGMFTMDMKNISKGVEGLEGVITTGWKNPFKYHEAFHGVFRMLLTDAEIKKYLNIAKKEVKAKLRSEGKTLSEALNEMRKQHSMYAEMPQNILEERLYEEYLADEFEKFKMNPSSTKTSTETKSIFRRIIDFIVEVLTNFRGRKLNHLFEGIDSGKYKNTSIKENRFTQAFDGDAAFKLELISDDKFIKRTAEDGSSKLKQVKNYIPADQVHEITSGIANLYVQRLGKAKSNQDRNLIMDSAIADFVGMYNPERSFYIERGEWYDNNVDELELLYESLLEQTDDIKELVLRHVKEFHAASEQIEDIDFTEQVEKTTGDYDKSADMFGGYASLPKRIRHIIATTTIAEEDRYGNKYVNEETGEPLMISVNPHNVYNGLLKVLANLNSDLEIFQKAWAFGKNNPHTKAVVDRIFTQLGLYEFATSGELMKKDAEMPSQVSDSALYISFVKGMNKMRVDNIFEIKDKNTGISHLFAANKKDDAHHTVKQWAEVFNRKYSKIRIEGTEENESVKDNLMALTSLLKMEKINENFDIQTEAEDISNSLKEASGINLHPNYILYSIYSNLSDRLTEEQEILFDSYSHVDPIEVESISMIRQSITLGENIYLDNQTLLSVDENEGTEVTYEKGGVKGRLRKIALNNAQFDEAVGASTFIDSEGNRRHAHQDPTFHLEKIAEMKGNEYIVNKKAEDSFLKNNMLLNDPKFKAMVENGEVKSLRIVGSKEESLMLGELDVTARKGDVKGKGISFGKSKPREFILGLLHSYLHNYNRISPDKTKTGSVKDTEFATAPIFIRVLEASNTGDLVVTPIQKMVDRKKQGINISDNAIKKFKNEIKIEFDRAREYYKNEKEGVDNPYENKERQGRLHMTYTLLTKLETLDRNIKAKLPKIGKDQRASITDNNQTVFLADSKATIYSNLSQDESAIVEIDNESFKMINKGLKNIADFTELEKLTLIERLGDAVSTVETDKAKFPIDIDGVEHYVYNSNTQKFFTLNKDRRGRQDLTVFEFVRVEEVEDLEIALTEKDTEVSADLKKKDQSAVDRIEEVARNGIKNEDGTNIEEKDLFNMVFDEVGGEELIRERLMDEINEFILTLKEIKAYDKISTEISQGLGRYKKMKDGTKTTYDSSENEYWQEMYNLKENDVDFNIAQIYLNNYINAKSFNQILLGDQALSIKNFVDGIKRAKMQNAAGPSAATEIYDENVGVMHKVDHMSGIVFEDFEVDRQFSEGSPQSEVDGVIYITPKGQRYLNYGFNGLTKAQSNVLDDIQEGNEDKINEEFFGGRNRFSHKQLDAIANSMKVVYGDGKTYNKMSATMLSRNLVSFKDDQGNWIAKEGKDKMHNLLNKMEAEEARAWSEGKGTIVLAIPKSASKMMNMNVVKDNATMTDASPINPENITDLSASSMRLQMINPSNKLEIVDARQIKNLITGEHDLNAEVILDGKVVTVKELRRMYHKNASDKLLTNYFTQRNLTFSFAGAMNAMEKVQNINKFVPADKIKSLKTDLHAFVKYAIAGLEASQAKTQMLSYFKVDENGNPEFNLNAPMVNEKMEQLFLSYFSKGVLAGKQPGISAALVPSYGHSVVKRVKQVDESGTPIDWTVIRNADWEVLKRENPTKYTAIAEKENLEDHVLTEGDFYLDRLRFNVMEYKDNKPTGQRYSEFMMPPHFKSQLDNKTDWSQPLPDAIAKMFGIRIPSQDKHSAVNLKLVDYLPVYMGSSAMYARELVELSGADFDIDKLYMQIKSFFHDGKNFVEYGKVKDNKEGYRHYIRNVIENATKSGTIRQAIDKWSDKDSKIIDNSTSTTIRAEDYANMDATERSLYHKRLTESNDKIVIEILDAVMHGVSPEQKLVDSLYRKTEGLPEALEMLGLPVTYDEYVAFKETNNREPYGAAIDNDILDIKFALLGNSGMTETRPGAVRAVYFEPAVTDPIEEAWVNLQRDLEGTLQVLGENQRDIDSMLGMFEAWVNNKGGAEAIGSVVLPNTTSSIITEFKTKLRRGDGFPIPEMNGIKYNTFEFDYARNHETKKADPSQYRKQFIISALITQATDNAKNPLISKLNLNKKILPTLVTMLSLGVDLNSAILMINNPSIKEALFLGDNKDNITDPGFKTLIENRLTIINDLLVKEKVKTQVAVNTENLITAMRDISFDRESDYTTYNTEEVSDELLLEKAILEQFIIFSDITETLNSATRLLNLQTGLGADIAQFESFQEAAEELGLTLSNEQFKTSRIPVDLRHIFLKENMHGTHYKVFRELYDDLTPLVMLKRTEKFVNLKDKVLANLDNSKFKMTSNQKKEVQRDIVNYLTLKAYIVALSKDKYAGKTLESLQNALIYDGKIYKGIDERALSIKDVLDAIKMKLDKAGKKNMFIDDFTRYIGAEHEDNKSGRMKLESNTWMQFSDSELTRVQNSVLELLMLDEGSGDMYDNVMHIVHYLAVTNGMSFGDGSFINVIPTVLTKDLLNSVDKVHELFLDTKEREGAFKSVFGMSFDEITDELVRGYLKSKGTSFYIKELKNVKVIKVDDTLEKLEMKADEQTEAENQKMLETEPVLVNEPEKTLTIDMFKGIPTRYIQRSKGIRFLRNQGKNQKNIALRNKHIAKLEEAGFNIRWIDRKIGDRLVSVPQAEFPAVISPTKGKYYALKTVYRDGAYKKEGDLNTIIPSDSNIAYGNQAEYVEIELEGSSTQTRIGFLFGNRPTHNEIVQYGNDKALAMGEEVVSEEQEQDAGDVFSKMGINPQTTEENSEMYDEHGIDEYGQEQEFEMIENEDNQNELSEEEMLTDFYDGLTPEQQSKLATDEELQITSSKKVVSLLGKGFTANQIMELLKKCYI